MWKSARFDLEEVKGLLTQAKERGRDLIYLIEENGAGVYMAASEDALERELYPDAKVLAKACSAKEDGESSDEPYPILIEGIQKDIDELRPGDPVLVKYSDIGVFVAVPVKKDRNGSEKDATDQESSGEKLQ